LSPAIPQRQIFDSGKKIKIEHQTAILLPMYLVQYHTTICCTYEPTADTKEIQPPLAHITTHNTQQKTENTITMVPPSRRLPAAPILQVSAIAVRRGIDINLGNTEM
jgi:hypothetical protein